MTAVLGHPDAVSLDEDYHGEGRATAVRLSLFALRPYLDLPTARRPAGRLSALYVGVLEPAAKNGLAGGVTIAPTMTNGKPGRRPLDPTDETTRVCVTLPSKMFADVKVRADAADITVPEQMRRDLNRRFPPDGRPPEPIREK